MSKPNTNSSNTGSSWTPKRIAAILVIILLVVMYLITLVAAIFDPTAGGKLFGIALFATIAVPLVAWIYLWMYARLTGGKAIGDPELPKADVSESEEEKKDEQA